MKTLRVDRQLSCRFCGSARLISRLVNRQDRILNVRRDTEMTECLDCTATAPTAIWNSSLTDFDVPDFTLKGKAAK